MLLCALLAASVGVARAGDIRWTGASGSYWEDGANWAGGKKPDRGDTAVFDPGEGKPLSVVSVGKDDALGYTYSNCRNFRFLIGVTTLDIRKGQLYIVANGEETEIFVAEGATGTISNNLVTGLEMPKSYWAAVRFHLKPDFAPFTVGILQTQHRVSNAAYEAHVRDLAPPA